jgi:hypothetical protein
MINDNVPTINQRVSYAKCNGNSVRRRSIALQIYCVLALVSVTTCGRAEPHLPCGGGNTAALQPDIVLSRAAWHEVSPLDLSSADNRAVSQTAELDGSDPDFAGMMIRCREGKLETIFVVLNPLAPRTTARVRLQSQGGLEELDGSPIPTGAGISIPVDPLVDLQSRWRGGKLEVALSAEGSDIHGVINLDGLIGPLMQLNAKCGTDMNQSRIRK